jgi:UDP-N-acetylglucosamine transferase subunit ALG13
MILVTVGTEQYAFNRLMRWIQLLLSYDFIQEEVIVQYGTCTILPAGVKVYQMLKGSDFVQLMTQARLVISHCGEGTILLLEELAKPCVLVPRTTQFREHIDDHQVELAIALAQAGASIAWSPGDLVRQILSPTVGTVSTLSTDGVEALCQKLNSRCNIPTAFQSSSLPSH